MDDTERCCAEDGTELKVSEEPNVVPARVEVARHILRKYAYPACEENVKTASATGQAVA